MDIRSFEKTFDYIARRESPHKVFDDFLTMCICCFSMDYSAGKSRFEDEYMKIVKQYDPELIREHFPKLMSELIIYMEENFKSPSGNDLLGEFYQQRLSDKRHGVFFTPSHLCQAMALMNGIDKAVEQKTILDPACGSGRTLVAAGSVAQTRHVYYGIDILSTCVKMSVINVFLNGLQGEIICANGLDPNDFQFGYTIKNSLPPNLGIWKIEEAKNSVIYNTNQAMKKECKDNQEMGENGDSQLVLF